MLISSTFTHVRLDLKIFEDNIKMFNENYKGTFQNCFLYQNMNFILT